MKVQHSHSKDTHFFKVKFLSQGSKYPENLKTISKGFLGIKLGQKSNMVAIAAILF